MSWTLLGRVRAHRPGGTSKCCRRRRAKCPRGPAPPRRTSSESRRALRSFKKASWSSSGTRRQVWRKQRGQQLRRMDPSLPPLQPQQHRPLAPRCHRYCHPQRRRLAMEACRHRRNNNRTRRRCWETTVTMEARRTTRKVSERYFARTLAHAHAHARVRIVCILSRFLSLILLLILLPCCVCVCLRGVQLCCWAACGVRPRVPACSLVWTARCRGCSPPSRARSSSASAWRPPDCTDSKQPRPSRQAGRGTRHNRR